MEMYKSLFYITCALVSVKGSCTTPGACMDSHSFLQTVSASNLCHCYAQCHFFSDCLSYTYKGTSGQCDQFSNLCSNLETDDCDQCLSGPQDCAPNSCAGDTCLINYGNSAKPVSTEVAEDLCDCFFKCSLSVDCIFYSFDSSNKECSFYDIEASDEGEAVECSDCVTGTYFCEPKECN